MKFLEKDLEQILMETTNEDLQDKGLLIEGKKVSQLRIGNYGIADIVTFKRNHGYNWNGTRLKPYLEITIFELKKDKVGISAFLQAIGYAKGIKRYLELRKFYKKVKFNIVLVGNEIDKSSTFSYLEDFIDSESFSLNNYTYSVDINGLHFINEHGYRLDGEGAQFNSLSKLL